MMAYAPETGYEVAYAQNLARRGPLRFEEGVATDTDVPNSFGRGAYGDTAGDYRGRQTMAGMLKTPEETMAERVHVGSAAWAWAPEQLDDFVQGAFSDHPVYETVYGDEYRQYRHNPTRIG